LDWTPKVSILPETLRTEPSKPTECRGFDGFDGSFQSESKDIAVSSIADKSLTSMALSEENHTGTGSLGSEQPEILPLIEIPEGIQTLNGANCRLCGDRRKWRLGPNLPFNCMTCHPPATASKGG
jgi:hypothetical protein